MSLNGISRLLNRLYVFMIVRCRGGSSISQPFVKNIKISFFTSSSNSGIASFRQNFVFSFQDV